MTSKSIHIILSYTIAKLVHLLEHLMIILLLIWCKSIYFSRRHVIFIPS